MSVLSTTKYNQNSNIDKPWQQPQQIVTKEKAKLTITTNNKKIQC
jgi:hypothetical protein